MCISALDDASRLMNIEAFGLMNLATSKSDCFVISKTAKLGTSYGREIDEITL